jgi:hypothetical protein
VNTDTAAQGSSNPNAVIGASMLPVREILLQSGRLLRRHPVLFLPVVAGALSFQVATGGQTSASLPILVAFWLLNLALTAGLLSMIRSYHQTEMSGWDAFLIGIGRHFTPILAGSLVQLGLVFLTLVPILAWLKSSVGIPDVKPLMNGVIPTPAQADQIAQWTAALVAWGAVWGIVYFFLALWKQAIVVQGISWLPAWKTSASFVRGHWLQIAAILTLQGVGLAFGAAPVLVRLDGLSELGAVLMLLVNCYFAVVMMVALLGPARLPKGENVDAAA